MAVKVGSARINEKGGITGGKAGDQTGGEVSTQNWYLHNKGWTVIRPKASNAAEKIAKCMEMACANSHIGYCQSHRESLKSAAGRYNYDVSKVKSNVEVDCSALVRVCCLYAGINAGNFTTSSEVSVLKSTGEFEILTSDKYCKSSDLLKRGDILVTKTSGHTVVVLNNGNSVQESGKSYTGNSIVEYLNSIGMNSSKANRARLAEQYGVSGYDCSAEKNMELLDKMRNGQGADYYPKYTGKSLKIDEVLKAIGVPEKYRGKWNNRKPIADKNGIVNYKGSMLQNMKLISLAKAGKLKRV